MKHPVFALLVSTALLAGSSCALAVTPTYVFPYEGFRYTQGEAETVLTQTNLNEHLDLIESLGTTADTILASYVASGIVMEVIPDDGGQIAVSVTDAGSFSSADSLAALSAAQQETFYEQFASSGLYETCTWVQSTPLCVRMTTSAMYASMPVYTLRYATLHLGRLYMLTQTIVGREPEQRDDEQMTQMLSRITLLSIISDPTPSPTPVPTPEPTATPIPTPGLAQVSDSVGELTLHDVPAFTSSAALTLSGTAEASKPVRVTINGETIASGTVKRDGTFSLNVTLPREGLFDLTVSCEDAHSTLTLSYQMPQAALTLNALESGTTSFTGTNVRISGVTEPDATVYISGTGNNVSAKANRSGAFSARIYINTAGTTQTFTLRAKADGFAETTRQITLTREMTEREWLTAFRQEMISLNYSDLAADPQRYLNSRFILRGRVMAFTDYNGSPCVLTCVSNPATGVWQDPLYIILGDEIEVQLDDIITFYLEGEGITLPADGAYTADGLTTEAPVTRALYITNNR